MIEIVEESMVNILTCCNLTEVQTHLSWESTGSYLHLKNEIKNPNQPTKKSVCHAIVFFCLILKVITKSGFLSCFCSCSSLHHVSFFGRCGPWRSLGCSVVCIPAAVLPPPPPPHPHLVCAVSMMNGREQSNGSHSPGLASQSWIEVAV